MRYSIDHVLEGIQLHRKAQMEVLATKMSARSLESEALNERRATAPSRLEDVLLQQATRVAGLPVLGRDDFNTVREAITRLERSVPDQYEVDNTARKVQQLRQEHADLATVHAVGDTTLEQFLHALQAGGETHVSQHGLKQAGFNGEPITRYIVARLQAVAETPNG